MGRDYCTRDLSKWQVMPGPRAELNTAIKFRFTPELPKMRTRRVIEPRHVEIAPMIWPLLYHDIMMPSTR